MRLIQTFAGGDGKELCATDHPTLAGTFSNELSTPAELNETSLEQSLIDIAALTDERGLKIAAQGTEINNSFSVTDLLLTDL